LWTAHSQEIDAAICDAGGRLRLHIVLANTIKLTPCILVFRLAIQALSFERELGMIGS